MTLPFPTDHRSFAPPTRPWIMWQSWHDVLFAHWPVAPERLRPLIPVPLRLDTFDGQAWIGVVPFHMTGIRPRCLPALPGLSAFPEINVRTYVTLDGIPGVLFFSLDATSRLAVRAARSWFHLPYHDAKITCRQQGDWTYFDSVRIGTKVRFRGRYRPAETCTQARPGSLEHWLTERYCMYPVDRHGQVCRGHVHHVPWRLQTAQAEIEVNTMTRPLGISLPGKPLLHFSRHLRVVIWPLETVARTRGASDT